MSAPFLVKYLLETYSFSGTYLVLALIFLNSCAGGLSYRTVVKRTTVKLDLRMQTLIQTRPNTKVVKIEEISSTIEERSMGMGIENTASEQGGCGETKSNPHDNITVTQVKEDECSRRSSRRRAAVNSVSVNATKMPHSKPQNQIVDSRGNGEMKGETFTDHDDTEKGSESNKTAVITYWGILLAVLCFGIASASTGLLLPSLAKEHGFKSFEINIALLVKGIMKAFPVLPIAMLLSQQCMKPYIAHSFCVFLIISGVSAVLMARVKNLISFIAMVGLNAVSNELVNSQLSTLLSQVSCLEKMPVLYGRACGIQGVVVLIWPIIVGK